MKLCWQDRGDDAGGCVAPRRPASVGGRVAEVVLLSQASLQAHLATHLEVGIEDYRLIPEMLDKGEVSTNRASCG